MKYGSLRFALAGFAVAFCAPALPALADSDACRLLPDLLERGEERDVLLCGAGLEAPVTLVGVADTGLEVVYRRPPLLREGR
jgi:hypothetical protein